jgi:hypothetical protein
MCAGAMEQRIVAPCFDCGHDPSEIGEFERKEHEYHAFKLWGEELVLCDFCDADFGSYFPEYWGLPEGLPQEYPLTLLRKVESPTLSKDMYCVQCKHRLAFLNFLRHARAYNAA